MCKDSVFDKRSSSPVVTWRIRHLDISLAYIQVPNYIDYLNKSEARKIFDRRKFHRHTYTL